MIKGEFGELTDMAEGHRCPEHDNPLAVAWHQGVHQYVIRCGAGHFPDELRDRPSNREAWKQGELGAGSDQADVEKIQARRRHAVATRDQVPDVDGVPRQDLSTGEVLNPDQLLKLAQYAVDYGLDPRRGHVCLMYGKPYPTLDAYLYHARGSGRPYTLTSRPVRQDERGDYLIVAGDHAWLAEVQLLDTHETYQGLGIVTADERAEMSKRDPTRQRSPVAAGKPWQMANKRARRDALVQAFPLVRMGRDTNEGRD